MFLAAAKSTSCEAVTARKYFICYAQCTSSSLVWEKRFVTAYNLWILKLLTCCRPMHSSCCKFLWFFFKAASNFPAVVALTSCRLRWPAGDVRQVVSSLWWYSSRRLQLHRAVVDAALPWQPMGRRSGHVLWSVRRQYISVKASTSLQHVTCNVT